MMEFSSVHRQRTVEALKEVFVAVERFQPEATEVEKRWQIPLRVQKGWQQLDLIDYQGVLFLSLGSELNCTYDQLKRTVGGTLQVKHRDLLREVYQSLCDISRQVAKDPLAYHKEMLNHLSPTIRFGTISRQFCYLIGIDSIGSYRRASIVIPLSCCGARRAGQLQTSLRGNSSGFAR